MALTRATAVETSAKNIDSMYVDETSQNSINNYNRAVNVHNAQVELLKKDAQPYTDNFNRYNSQVDAYNNFLQTSCTKN